MKPTALFLLAPSLWDDVYGPEERRRVERLVQPAPRFHSRETLLEHPEDLAKADYLFSSWGMEICDAAFLDRAPNLKGIFYAAGSVRYFVTDELWTRGIVLSTSNTALAVSVAEFTLAQILLALKGYWRNAASYRTSPKLDRLPFPGIYDSTVGLVSLGAIGRHVIALLRPFRLRVVAYDPFLTEEGARQLGVEKVSLEELFEISDVVSLHTPHLPETEGMIRGHHLERLPRDGTFINTARGALVNEAEMAEVLRRRQDLLALLDVTHPEPAAPDSPLRLLPNVVLTPHIAGAMGRECRRLGAMAVDEFERHLRGEPLQGEVRQEMMHLIA